MTTPLCFTCFVQRQSFSRSVVSTLSAKLHQGSYPSSSTFLCFSRPPSLNLARLLGRLGCKVCHHFSKKIPPHFLCSSSCLLALLRGTVSYSGHFHLFRKLISFSFLPSALSRFRLGFTYHDFATLRRSGFSYFLGAKRAFFNRF